MSRYVWKCGQRDREASLRFGAGPYMAGGELASKDALLGVTCCNRRHRMAPICCPARLSLPECSHLIRHRKDS